VGSIFQSWRSSGGYLKKIKEEGYSNRSYGLLPENGLLKHLMYYVN